MSRRQRPSQRGAALLIVLATLIFALSASVTLARVASTAKAGRDVGDRAVMADELLRAADAAILGWLKTKSSTVVLPPEATTPQVDVLHDVWVLDNTRHELRVTAWDQLGMVPLQTARSGSPLRLALPAEIRRAVDRVELPRGEPPGPGLDLFSARLAASVDVFPKRGDGDLLIFGPKEEVGVSDRPASPHDDEREAVGAHVATHNPGRINVNTAPIALVDQALRVAGRGGLEQIVEARADGRSAAPAGGRETPGRGRTTVQLTSSSTAWAFRIDTSVGATQGASVRRSWWAVYLRSGSHWECVQRLAILE